MKTPFRLLPVALPIALAACCTRPASAQQYVHPSYNSCVEQFYDRNEYGWLAFRNVCGQAISVTFVGNNSSSGTWGSMDLEPGRQSSTGRAASEIRAAGGLEIYVCPQGYVPVDAQGNAIGSHTVSEFKCEQQ